MYYPKQWHGMKSDSLEEAVSLSCGVEWNSPDVRQVACLSFDFAE